MWVCYIIIDASATNRSRLYATICHFQTLEELKAAGLGEGDKSGWQTGLERGYQRGIQKHAARDESGAMEALSTHATPQPLTLIGIYKEFYKQAYERSRRRRRFTPASSLKDRLQPTRLIAKMIALIH